MTTAIRFPNNMVDDVYYVVHSTDIQHNIDADVLCYTVVAATAAATAVMGQTRGSGQAFVEYVECA